jgi:hypothetical protein
VRVSANTGGLGPQRDLGLNSPAHYLFILGKLAKIPEPLLPNLYNGNNDSSRLVILSCRLNKLLSLLLLSLLFFSLTKSYDPGAGGGREGGGPLRLHPARPHAVWLPLSVWTVVILQLSLFFLPHHSCLRVLKCFHHSSLQHFLSAS